jgi:hypothetical protein
MTISGVVESREIRLASRPAGTATDQNFTLATAQLGPLRDGYVLIKNQMMSVEPYMRARMNAGRSYVRPFDVGAALSGAAIGTVVASADASVAEGATVMHDFGWRDYAVAPASAVSAIDTAIVSPEAYLSALGTTGFTAWVGLRAIARVQAGETLFVSAAAGAIGSMVVQLAKRFRLRVIGSAGSAARVDYLRDRLRADAAFDYHNGPVRNRLREAAPDGIDVYFDNTGGGQLEAALGAMREHGRIVLCGAVAGYDSRTPPPGPRNLHLAISRRVRIEGFMVLDHRARFAEFLAEVAPLVRDGIVATPAPVVEGLEKAPQAFIDILRSNASAGNVLVRIG